VLRNWPSNSAAPQALRIEVLVVQVRALGIGRSGSAAVPVRRTSLQSPTAVHTRALHRGG